ncbi:MAG: BON domain-containing protein [Pseudomonadota bacterium]
MKSLINRSFIFVSTFFVLATVGCAGSPTHESTGQYVDDATLTGKVKTALIKDDAVKARDINVETFKGVVQLSGFADSQAEINKAVEDARNVEGVQSVKNDLHLKAKQ